MKHNFVLSYRYELPFGKMFGANRWSNGWVLTGVTRFTTGLPVTLIENDDNSLLGTNFTGPNENGVDLPNFTPGSLKITDPRAVPTQCGQLPTLFQQFTIHYRTLGAAGECEEEVLPRTGINNWTWRP